MKSNKYYAVKKGRNIGVYLTWEECLIQVDKYPGAEYKSFKTEKEAKDYLNNKEKTSTKKEVKIKNNKDNEQTNNEIEMAILKLKKNEGIAFVDGSYLEDKNDFKMVGFGIVIIINKETIKLSGVVKDEELLQYRNVTGEIYAAMNAIIWAYNNNVKKLTIYYDYEGIRSWATKLWKTNNELTTSYAKFIDEYKDKLSISFKKVLAHSGIIYNEMVDELASQAIANNK